MRYSMDQTLLDRASFSEALITKRLQQTVPKSADAEAVLQACAGWQNSATPLLGSIQPSQAALGATPARSASCHAVGNRPWRGPLGATEKEADPATHLASNTAALCSWRSVAPPSVRLPVEEAHKLWVSATRYHEDFKAGFPWLPPNPPFTSPTAGKAAFAFCLSSDNIVPYGPSASICCGFTQRRREPKNLHRVTLKRVTGI